MERVESVQPVESSPASLEAADAFAGTSLARLVAEYTSLGPLSGAGALARVVAWLESAPATEANAKELLSLLDADTFGTDTDAQGRPLKVVALLALLRFGYPWALQMKPEDLAWLRDAQRPWWRKNLKNLVAVGLWLVLAGEVAFFTWPLWWPLW